MNEWANKELGIIPVAAAKELMRGEKGEKGEKGESVRGPPGPPGKGYDLNDEVRLSN